MQKSHLARRQKLLENLAPNQLVLISSGTQKQRNSDVMFPFRAHSNFLYLTGLNEPNSVALISHNRFVLFVTTRSPKQVIWEGECLGLSGAINTLGANQAHDITELTKELPKLLLGFSIVSYDFGFDLTLDTSLITAVASISNNRKGEVYPIQYHALTPILAQQRIIKDDAEISKIQQAIDISIQAHKTAMLAAKPGKFEYQISAIFDQQFSANNAQTAYPHIVAGGKNACVLHYINNNKILKDGDLLLIDAGSEVAGYASDITRTFPVGDKFSPEQAIIYQLVLDAQIAAIEAIKPGVLVSRPNEIVKQIITQGLRKIGLLSPNSDEKSLKQFFMHGTGHWLGLDVHDVGAYKINQQYRKFETGMITTVEPGIYISHNSEINPIWHGIGVRIEDDILITKTGNKNLSQALIKEIHEIEQYKQQEQQ